MKRILCPTDFSEASLNAIEYAAKIGEQHHSKITLLYVIIEDQINDVIKKGGDDLSLEEWKLLAIDKLKKISQEVKSLSLENGLVDCDYVLIVGDLIKTIVKYCKDERYDLIIMGTSGVRDVTEEYMGSNTYKLIQKSHCPVMCVPIRAMYNGFNKVVYATDYQEEDKVMIQEMIFFCYPFNAQLDILHISKTNALIDQAVYDQFKTELKNFILYENINFEKKVYKDDISLGIDEYLTDEKGDLLVLLAKHRNFIDQLFHRSVIKRMSYFTDYPILVFKG